MLAGASFIPLLFLPGRYISPYLNHDIPLRRTETYGPVLHARRIRANRTWIGQSAKPTPLVSRGQSMQKTISVALFRPFRMFAEPIVLAVSIFMAMVYAIFYLFFEAYPIIFGGKKLFPGFTNYLFALGSRAKSSTRSVPNDHRLLCPCLHT